MEIEVAQICYSVYKMATSSMKESKSVSHSVMSDSLWAHQAPLSRNFPSRNTGVGCPSLLQGIFLTQGSNLDLPHCSQILYCLSHQGSPLEALWDKYQDFEMIWLFIYYPLQNTRWKVSICEVDDSSNSDSMSAFFSCNQHDHFIGLIISSVSSIAYDFFFLKVQ